jgi:hypothetical protein
MMLGTTNENWRMRKRGKREGKEVGIMRSEKHFRSAFHVQLLPQQYIFLSNSTMNNTIFYTLRIITFSVSA